MAANGVAFSESIVHATKGRVGPYAYRSGLGMMPSAEFNVFHDDFNELLTTNVPAGWTAAVIDTGATLVADTTAGVSSTLIFDSDGATEGVAIYLPKAIQLTAGKKFFMEIRLKTELADDRDVKFGLTDLTATTNPEDLWTTTAASVIAFGVLDGSALLKLLADSANAGTAVVASERSMTSATWHTLAIGYDGVTLKGYIDGQEAASTTTTIPTGVALAPFVGFRNGSAATTEGQIDYVRYAQER